MAVHKPAPRPVLTQTRRPNPVPGQAQGPAKARVGETIGERRTHAAQPHVTRETAPRGLLQSARDMFAHRTTQRKPVHAANAKYHADPRPQSPLRAVTKDTPHATSSGLLSHGEAVDFLTGFLTRAGKIRSKA